MVNIFNLWNLYQYTDLHYAFDVTRANAPSMANGTEELIERCLGAFGVVARVRSWSVAPFRSHYFTDYADSEDWTDRWQLGWRVDVTTGPSAPTHENVLLPLPQHVDLTDASWEDEYEDPRHDGIALFITMHEGELAAVEQFSAALVAKAGEVVGQGVETRGEVRSFAPGVHQLRLALEGPVFPDAVRELDNLLKWCRRDHVATNWRDM